MIARIVVFVLIHVCGKAVRKMLVRLYAGEIILGKIGEETVPAGLKDRVHEYLVEMGFYDEATEEA